MIICGVLIYAVEIYVGNAISRERNKVDLCLVDRQLDGLLKFEIVDWKMKSGYEPGTYLIVKQRLYLILVWIWLAQQRKL